MRELGQTDFHCLKVYMVFCVTAQYKTGIEIRYPCRIDSTQKYRKYQEYFIHGTEYIQGIEISRIIENCRYMSKYVKS